MRLDWTDVDFYKWILENRCIGLEITRNQYVLARMDINDCFGNKRLKEKYLTMFENEYSHRILEKKEKEYWYYLVWTLRPGFQIGQVRTYISKVEDRCNTLGIFYMDISYESENGSIREHYNMRIKSHKMVAKSRFAFYEKAGHIHYQPIKLKTDANWNNVGNYISKENLIEVLIE